MKPKHTNRQKLTKAQKKEILNYKQCIDMLKQIAGGYISYKKAVVVKGEIKMIEVRPNFTERRRALVTLQRILSGAQVPVKPLTDN